MNYYEEIKNKLIDNEYKIKLGNRYAIVYCSDDRIIARVYKLV